MIEEQDFPSHWDVVDFDVAVKMLDNQRVPVNAENREKRTEGLSSDEKYPYYGAGGQIGWIDDYIFDDELILIGEDGTVGNTYRVSGKTWVNNHAHVLKTDHDGITQEFLYYYLTAYDFDPLTTGAVQAKLNQKNMKKVRIPVPPLDEQERIVAIVEERLNAVKALEQSVQRVDEISGDYEDSMRSYIFSGAQDFKEKSPKGIPTERELPSSWKRLSISNVLNEIKGGTSHDQNEHGEGYPVTRIETISEGEIDPGSVKYVDIDKGSREYSRHIMQEGDILFSNINSPPHVGKTALYEGEPDELIHGMNLILMRPDANVVRPVYLEMCMQWLREEGVFENMCKNAINQASLAQKDIKPIEIPVPPLTTQEEIIQQLRQVDNSGLRDSTSTVGELFEEYRESVLNHAFSVK